MGDRANLSRHYKITKDLPPIANCRLRHRVPKRRDGGIRGVAAVEVEISVELRLWWCPIAPMLGKNSPSATRWVGQEDAALIWALTSKIPNTTHRLRRNTRRIVGLNWRETGIGAFQHWQNKLLPLSPAFLPSLRITGYKKTSQKSLNYAVILQNGANDRINKI